MFKIKEKIFFTLSILAVLVFCSCENDIEKVKNEIKNFAKNSSLYISLDIDVFDPSIAPGVKYPEPGGILFLDFQNIIEVIDAKIKGIDVCCMKDDSAVTYCPAIKSV